MSGIPELKKYFRRFGYLSEQSQNFSDDLFDNQLELAVSNYQLKHGLRVTGELDVDTVDQIRSPRCGVPDNVQMMYGTRRYVYFTGQPRWARPTPMGLTYALSKSPEGMISYLSLQDLRDALKRAFSRWSAVIPVTFLEIEDYDFADIKIGFYEGDHGDGEPFDGVLGVLAHAFSPENGRFHLDAAERWAVDFRKEKSRVAVDLESVATHEIGHLLGLTHSFVRGAVMYPSLKPRSKKVDLQVDDIKGVQALYGSNPNFRFGSLLESDTSSNQAADLVVIPSGWAILVVVINLSRIQFL